MKVLTRYLQGTYKTDGNISSYTSTMSNAGGTGKADGSTSKPDTTITCTRQKDPKRVEAGRRLGQISKQIREQRMRERIESELDTKGSWSGSLWGYLVGLGFREPLGAPESLKGTAKLALAVSLGALGTKYLQEKGMIPVDPFKGK